jgi:hypothetical protein
MPVRARKGRSVGIDAVPLPDRVAQGKLTRAGNRYYLTVAGRKREIPVGPLLTEASIRPLVGKDVSVAYSRKSSKSIVAIGTWPTPEWISDGPKFKCVLCYIPAPDVINLVKDSIRVSVIAELIKADIISRELGGFLRG